MKKPSRKLSSKKVSRKPRRKINRKQADEIALNLGRGLAGAGAEIQEVFNNPNRYSRPASF